MLFFLWRVPLGIFLVVFLMGFLLGSSVVWKTKGCSFAVEQPQPVPPTAAPALIYNPHRVTQ